MEELTRILMPIIEESVKRNIDKIASKISEKLMEEKTYKLTANTKGKNCIDFNSNEIDVETKFSADTHIGDGSDSLEGHSRAATRHDPKAKRCKSGTANLKEELSKTLGDWNIDTSDKTNFSFGLWQSRECGTTLQDYYLGEPQTFVYIVLCTVPFF